MIVEDETIGKQAFQSARASLDIEHPITLHTMEMVVVLCRNFGQLVAIRLSGDSHARNFLGFLELSNDAIHRAKAERRNGAGGGVMDFVDGKRSFRLAEYVPDRGVLARVPSFGHAEIPAAGGRVPEASALMSGFVRVTNASAMAPAATSTMSNESENVASPAVTAAQSKHTLAASVPRETVDPQLVQQ